MSSIRIIIITFQIVCNCTLLFSQDGSNEWSKREMLYGDINNDGIVDSLKIEFSSNPYQRYRWTIFENSFHGTAKKSTREVPSLKLFLKDMEMFNIFKGGIRVSVMHYYDGYEEGNNFDEIEYYFRYFPNLDGWYFVAERCVFTPDAPDDKPSVSVNSLRSTQEISKDQMDMSNWISIYSKEDSVFYNKKFNQSYNNYLQEFKNGKKDLIMKYGFIETIEYFQYVPLTAKNIVKFNDIAYFLCESEKYREAVDVLEIILESYPQRTVAYINLGDAYWGLDEKKYGKQAYEKYIKLMKTSGKESKIPQRVFDRVK